jgi:dolichol-phosphate mannosyltransferase
MKDNRIPYELVFVNDGPKDETWDILTSLTRTDPNVVAVNFSRNFGKEAAIFAGLRTARGDAVVLMDCDLQHPPEVIVEMYNIWKYNDVDVVEGRKKDRGRESKVYKAVSLWFYKLINSSSGLDMSGASDFKLLDRRAVDSLLDMPEHSAFFRAMGFWIGFKQIQVEYDVMEREAGESKWSTRSLIRYAFNNIAGYSTLPLQLVTGAGVVVFLLAVILGIQTLARYFSGHAVEGFTTVILLILMIGSIIMISLGITGYYIARIYEVVKRRPRYIISRTV